MTGDTKNENYSTRALYDVIKLSLLVKDKDLMHFIKTMNDTILEEFNKIKKSERLTLNEIINRYENYTIVYMMIRIIMDNAKISSYQERTRQITEYFLDDELKGKKEKPPTSVYDEED